MVTQGKFTLTGLSDYLETLTNAGRDIDSDVQDVLLKAGTDVQKVMQNLVPIDTGNLHDHIQLDGPHQTGNFSYVEVGVIHDIGFTDRETAIYGNVIEYGSSSVAAQPYIRPALKKTKGIIKKYLKEILDRLGLKV